MTPRELAGFQALAGGILRDVRVTIGTEEGLQSFTCYGCHPADEDGLVRVATSLPNHILIDKAAWEPGTAAFFALLRHEDVHQAQFHVDANFLPRYIAWEKRRAYLGQPPYKNPAEWHAYIAEVQAYHYALDVLRLPPGRRIPLLLAEARG